MKNIEIEKRECFECGEVYDWNLRNIYGLCVPCRKRHYRKSAKKKPEDYKKPYPLNENEKRVRYRRIQRELDEAETPEARRAVYSRELDFMIQSGIWEWCTDLRFSTKIIQKGGKVGRPFNKTAIAPDTRGIYEPEQLD